VELKVGYKQTEIGTVPIDWVEKQIGELHPYVTSGSRGWAAYYSDHGAPFIRITNLIRSSIYLCLDDLRFVNIPEGCSEGARTQLQNGDVLISITADIGIVGFVSENVPKPSYINQHIALIRFDPSSVHSQFVSYFLASDRPQRLFRALTDSGAKAGMNLSTVQQVRLNLPPTKVEQEAIAGALSDADALIQSLERLLTKKRQIKQSAKQELLTGKKRLPGFENPADYQETEAGFIPADWRQVSLLEACSKIQDGTHFSPRAGGRDFLYVTSKNIRYGFLDLSTAESIDAAQHQAIYKRCDVRKGDLLLTKDGANTGNAALNSLDEQFSLLSSVAFLRFDVGIFNADYFVHQILSFHGQRQIQEAMSGNAITRLTLEKIRKLTFPVPPTKSEQDAIATVLSTIDAETALTESKLTKARQLKQGMMQELLTGRIRLVQPSAEVVPFPVKQSASVGTNANHNPQINEAVVLAVLAHWFGSEQFPLGRFRRTKLSYLLHRHSERQVTGFLKKAAGPYSPQTRYGGAEKIALKNGYVRIHKVAKSEGFIAADNIAQAEGYFENWYGLQVLDWLKQFRYKKNEELELLTTVDMAIEDLRREGKNVTVPAVKQIIHDSPEWKAKLDRATFADSNITAAIESCRQLFPVEE
jgi:restriction endonuclease S subunit